MAGVLKNHRLAQAISDSNFGEIRRQLEYKAAWHGVHLVTIDCFYPSSKTCSGCGWKQEELSLSERVFVCQHCGYVAERDYNAAKNILHEALRRTESSSGTDAYGESSSGLHTGASETALVEVGTNLHVGVSYMPK